MSSSSTPSEQTKSTSLLVAFLCGWQLPLLAAIVPPSVAAAIGAITVIKVFRGMALAGVGGIGAFSMGLYEANRALVVALILAAAVTLLLGALQLAKSAQRLTWPLLLVCGAVAVLGSVPALLLWRAESLSIAVVSDVNAPASVAEASQRLSALLVAATLGGFAAPPFAVAAVVVVWLISRRSSAQAHGRLQGLTWLVIGLLLATLAGAYCVRSAWLHETAVTGSPRPVA